MRIVRLFAVLTALALSASIAVAEPPAGTKNFTAPSGVPNYFSNEAGAPMTQRGVIHHVAPEPALTAEPARGSTRVAAAHRHRGRHHVASRHGHRATKLAAAKGKHRATKVASAKTRHTKTATARSGSERHAAPAKAKATKTAARVHTPPAKAKQPAHHAG